MRSQSIASAAVGILAAICLPTVALAQTVPPQVERVASLTSGSIAGIVQDEKGAAVAGAVVSALGATTAVAVTDRSGKFELPTLSPGPYLVRAYLSGFVTPGGVIVEVRGSSRTSSSIALRRIAETKVRPYPILAAGLTGAPAESSADSTPELASNDPSGDEMHAEVAWRLRHARRGVLKEATFTDALLGDSALRPEAFGRPGLFGRASDSSARVGTNLFSNSPFSGQFNLLTAGSFDTPQQLFSSESFSRGIAYLSVGAAVGEHADWRVRGALTQGDISAWIVAAAYTTRAPARHRYRAGLSYSTQRYQGGNLAALRDVADGSRNVGGLYGFDTFVVTPGVSVTYGARVARYDYLDKPGLVSPRLGLTLSPFDRVRINAVVSRRALAPGAEEFAPPVESAIWLPPQRTFSSLDGGPLEAERTNHLEVGVERDIAAATLSVRAFHQQVGDQIATLFGIDMPNAPAHLGHYFVANAGDVEAAGWSAGLRASLAPRVHGSVRYTLARAHWTPADNLGYLVLLTPSVLRLESEHVHDLATSVEAQIPETSTRLVVLYRMSNAFAVPSDRPGFDSRFDVQVRQSLPFMDFGSAKWEMLFAVRSLFREFAADSSIYDELLVVRPPKRIVGGLTLHF